MFSGEQVLRKPAARLFLGALGIKVDPFEELEQFKLACEQANPRYQGERDLVRFVLEKDCTEWPEEVADATMNLAGCLGMLHGETPLTGKWDIIIALGGARRSPLHRVCFAAQAIKEYRASTTMLIVGGSTRALSDAEKEVVQDFAPNAQTEYDLCTGAAGYITERHMGLADIATTCKDDPRSGNDGVIDETVKTFKSMFSNRPLSVAAVTTRIYTAGLELDMARAAKRHGWCKYGAAGHSTDPETVFNRSIAIYLSECLTTLRKAAIAAAEGC